MRIAPHIYLSWRGLLIILLFYALFMGGFAMGFFLGQPQGVAAMICAEDTPALAEEDGLLVVAAAAKTGESLEPRAVIYCTHASEEYAGQVRKNGVAGGVLTAARTLAGELEARGIGTILLTDIFDAPDWNKSYANSLAALKKVKAAYPDIELYIDVHRDAEIEGINTVLTDESGAYARMLLVVGSDANLPHPDWEKNLAFAKILNKEAEKLYPGLMRSLKIYKGRYNQHIAAKAILVEIGSTTNSVEQAQSSATLLAEAISHIL